MGLMLLFTALVTPYQVAFLRPDIDSKSGPAFASNVLWYVSTVQRQASNRIQCMQVCCSMQTCWSTSVS
jgi:hypothetical protein